MSPTGPVTNVYYLSPPATAEGPANPSHTFTRRLRLLAFWWRLRLTTREVVATLRRFGRPVDDDTAYLEQRAGLVLASTRPSVGPAQIIDFAAARQRLRA
jgi:hypothetical protein